MDIGNLSQSVLSDLIAALIVAALGALATKIGYSRAVGLAKSTLPVVLVFVTVAISVFAINRGMDYFSQQTKQGRLESAIKSMVTKDYPQESHDGWTIEVTQLEPRMILSYVYPNKIEAYQFPHKLNNEEVKSKVYKIVIQQGFNHIPVWGFVLHSFEQKEVNKFLERKL